MAFLYHRPRFRSSGDRNDGINRTPNSRSKTARSGSYQHSRVAIAAKYMKCLMHGNHRHRAGTLASDDARNDAQAIVLILIAVSIE